MEKKTDSPIRVLQVLGGLFHGGAEAMIMNLYRHIDTSLVQFDFLVHTPQEGVFDQEIQTRGGMIFHAPMYKGTNHLAYKKWWKDFLQQHQEYRCIHFHIRGTSSIAIPICKKYGRKTIIHAHSTSNGKSLTSSIKSLFQLSLRKDADFLFACSEPAGKWLFGENVLTLPNFHLLKNAIDTNIYQFSQEIRNHVRRELDLENAFVVGHIGRFIDAKNHGFLLDIFNEVLIQKPNAKLLLVGDGPNRKAIENKADKLEIRQSVIFVGFRSDVHKLLQAMDVFVFPSLFEGLPVTLIEAQANGLPCVASNTVPSEVRLTALVEFITLETPPINWAEQVVCKKRQLEEAQSIQNAIVEAGYDIVNSSKELQAFYLGII